MQDVYKRQALEEGEKTEIGDLAQTMSGGANGITDMAADHGNIDDEQPDSADGEAYTDPVSYTHLFQRVVHNGDGQNFYKRGGQHGIKEETGNRYEGHFTKRD